MAKYLVPHSPEWRIARHKAMMRRKLVWAEPGTVRPGPKPNPDLELSDQALSTFVTKRELKALMKAKPRTETKSLFVRRILVEWLEARRNKHAPTMPFTVDKMEPVARVAGLRP